MISDYNKGGLHRYHGKVIEVGMDPYTFSRRGKFWGLLEGYSQLPTAQIWQTEFFVKVKLQ